jgi:colanic acid biosynthesis glycosyl transferase WcaI
MHIFIHDYSGHPFQPQLSRELASRGIKVSHGWFCEDKGPKGKLFKTETDPNTLNFVPLGRGIEHSKVNFLKRRRGDIDYGRNVAIWIKENRPDVTISGNTPVEAQEYIQKTCQETGGKFIFWCQDLFSIAASKILSKRLPIAGSVIGSYYQLLEKRQMENSDYIIHITDGFLKQTDKWGISRDKIRVIPNWGALKEIPSLDRQTDWAQRQKLRRSARVIYSGTLAMKHNPQLLLEIASKELERADVIVVGSGVGADELAADTKRPPNLHILPIQPISDLPEVLASADVLVAVIEADAGEYSVPSKVLSYLCAGRPIVLAAPAENLAAKIVTDAGAGIVVPPSDTRTFFHAVRHFLNDRAAAASAGHAGRKYAEATFNVPHIADQFERIILEV